MSSAITLLDGGMGQELIRRSQAEKPQPLWSLQVMMDEPDLVADVHRDFCLAGAKVICLNTYSVTRQRLTMGNDMPSLAALLALARKLARAGIAASGKPGIDVIASLPPLTASYLTESPLTAAQMTAEYEELIRLHMDHVDGFIAETIPTIAKAQAALVAAQRAGVRIHLGFTVLDDDGTHLRSGESLADALTAVLPLDPQAVVINCSVPEAIDQGMPILAGQAPVFGAYANGFHSITALKPGGTVDVLTSREDLTPDNYAARALAWLDQGATILGGCCEVGPRHIETLATGIRARGHALIGLQ